VILLPADYTAWTTAKRLAVPTHEGAHVARRDSAIQLAAAVNHMVFWFNPFALWLQRHLSDLAEAASDDAAIAGLGDRVGNGAPFGRCLSHRAHPV
jgi:beta-lactamase regulating signal transducer with metallopeptidase domain